MSLPDPRVLHNEYFMNTPYSHMVFQDILPSLEYLATREFIDWLEKLTGFRELSRKISKKKRVEIHVCKDEDPQDDYELWHMRIGKQRKTVTSTPGTVIILNAELAHAIEDPEKTIVRSYYQPGPPRYWQSKRKGGKYA